MFRLPARCLLVPVRPPSAFWLSPAESTREDRGPQELLAAVLLCPAVGSWLAGVCMLPVAQLPPLLRGWAAPGAVHALRLCLGNGRRVQARPVMQWGERAWCVDGGVPFGSALGMEALLERSHSLVAVGRVLCCCWGMSGLPSLAAPLPPCVIGSCLSPE